MSSLGEFFIELINAIIAGLGLVIGGLFAIFPDSPFKEPMLPPSNVNLGWITWLFDFPTWIQHFALILTAIGTYYVIRVIARWVKVVRS